MAFAKYAQLVGLASLLLSTLPGISAFDRPTDLGRLRLDHHSLPFPLLSSLSTSKLPPPSATLLLKYVLLGRGTQNYTCSRNGSPPIPNGAVARLYDLSCYKCPRLIGNHLFSDPATPSFFLKDGSSIIAEKIANGPAPISAEDNKHDPSYRLAEVGPETVGTI